MYNYTNGHIHINTEEYGVYTEEKTGTRTNSCAEKVLSLFSSVTIIGVIHKSKYILEYSLWVSQKLGMHKRNPGSPVQTHGAQITGFLA